MQKPKIIFLHGALGAAVNLQTLMSLCDDFTCEVFEFPGHGNTPSGEAFSINYFTACLLAKLAREDQPVSVFGYSMGGYIALHALTQKPELFKGVMTLATKFNWTIEEGQKQASMLNPEKVAEKIPHYAQYLQKLHPAHDWQNVMRQTAALITELSANPPLQISRLSEIELPVCVGIGDHDQMVTLSETQSVFQQCKQGNLYVIPGMQHPIEKMNIQLVHANLRSFFKA